MDVRNNWILQTSNFDKARNLKINTFREQNNEWRPYVPIFILKAKNSIEFDILWCSEAKLKR